MECVRQSWALSSRCCSLRCRATSRTLVGSAPLYSVTGLTGMKISVDDWLYLSGVRRVCSGTSLAGKLGALEVRMLDVPILGVRV